MPIPWINNCVHRRCMYTKASTHHRKWKQNITFVNSLFLCMDNRVIRIYLGVRDTQMVLKYKKPRWIKMREDNRKSYHHFSRISSDKLLKKNRYYIKWRQLKKENELIDDKTKMHTTLHLRAEKMGCEIEK